MASARAKIDGCRATLPVPGGRGRVGAGRVSRGRPGGFHAGRDRQGGGPGGLAAVVVREVAALVREELPAPVSVLVVVERAMDAWEVNLLAAAVR